MNGRRPYNSGAPYGTWVAVGVLLKDERGEVIDQALVLIPAADLTVVDTWHTAGMRGTASYTLVGHDVFVPEHRVLSVPAAEIETARPHIYRAADEDKSLQRLWSDANTAARHAGLVPAVGLDVRGKTLVGVNDRVSLMV